MNRNLDHKVVQRINVYMFTNQHFYLSALLQLVHK